MASWIVVSWLLFVYVTYLSLALTYGCPSEWFGSGCQYKCHCTDNKCDVEDGYCDKGAKCQRGWFGPGCQYSDLATSDTVVKADQALNIVTDGDENTCLDETTNQITVTWTIPYQFTWFRVHVNDPNFLKGVFIQFKNTRSYRTTLCTRRSESNISETAMDVYCDVNKVFTQVIITGPGVQSLCSIYISGGRNVALKQNASQSSNLYKSGQSKPSNAVDGYTSGDLYNNSCSHTNVKDRHPQWNITFSDEVAVNRFVLYNRVARKPIMRRLQGFILTSFSKSGHAPFNYTDATKSVQTKYTITSATGADAIVVISIQATRVDSKKETLLSLCEVEIYGDSVCEPGLFGRDCENPCNCVEEVGTCFVSTGGCPSGCAPGYSGEGCGILLYSEEKTDESPSYEL